MPDTGVLAFCCVPASVDAAVRVGAGLRVGTGLGTAGRGDSSWFTVANIVGAAYCESRLARAIDRSGKRIDG